MLLWFAELLTATLIVIGGFFLFVGSLGLAKLHDLMRRLHGPTKATTLGIGAILIASLAYFWLVRGEPTYHEVLISIFMFLTAPVSAHMVAKAQILHDPAVQAELTPSGRPVGWATLDAPQHDGDVAAPR